MSMTLRPGVVQGPASPYGFEGVFAVVNCLSGEVDWTAMGATAPPTRTAIPADEAWSLMWRLFHRYGKGRMAAIASEVGLSPPQVLALRALDPRQPSPMSDLAGALRCDNSNVTGIVDRLEDRGLVERRPATHDRRVKMLVVTGEGARVRDRLNELFQAAPEPLAALAPEDQRALRDIVRKAMGGS
jgi:DNA-binding MarR family transcriptional regulator